MVIIDTFSKYVELYPVKSTASQELAKLVFERYICRHGVSSEIICDNGGALGCQFTQQLAAYVDINILYTPSQHASSNSIVERFMKTLRTMILLFTEHETIQQHWDKNLRLMRFFYNTMSHHATGTSPFELARGRIARTPVNTIIDDKMPQLC